MGCSAFLVGSGPSLNRLDLTPLARPGTLTLGVNNSAKILRPHLWACVDKPSRFLPSIWRDPLIAKFVPSPFSERSILKGDNTSPTLVKECPNVTYYIKGNQFCRERFLSESTLYWGDTGPEGRGRTVLLVALKILFMLGVRSVYMIGVDFYMRNDYKYCFDQDRSQRMIDRNNDTYTLTAERLQSLQSVFDEHDFSVFNCNPESHLTVFPFLSYEQAVKNVADEFSIDPDQEQTSGLYDATRGDNIARQSSEPSQTPQTYSE